MTAKAPRDIPLHKTWHFEPEINLETYIAAQLEYFHAQLLPETRE